MKKIFLICTLFLSFTASAQFTTRDSLRTYINKWIRNSAVESFSNLRLNTTLNGIVGFLDSTGLGGSSNNSSIGSGYRLAVPGTRNVKSLGKLYGITLDSSVSGQVNIKADSSTLYGYMRGHVSSNSHIVQGVSYLSSKSIAPISTENYMVTINGQSGYFKLDSTDNSTADDSAMVIVTSGSKRLKRIVDNQTLDVRWFGAVPDDGNDDWYAIQKAIDYAIYNSYKKVYIPGGEYLLSKGLLVWKDADQNGDPEFVNISIEGQTNAYAGTSQKETVLKSTNRSNFVLGIQKGKGCEVRNINLYGTNQLNYTIAQAWSGTQTFILDSQRTNQYSPYAGLVLDPFGSSTTGSNRYPGFESYYAGVSGNGGSTDCKFYNLVTNGFIVGVILTPNGNTQNNESHLFDGLWMSNCREGFVTTNSQERQVLVRNFKAWTSIKTIFQTNGYGAGRGEPPNIDGGNVAGTVYQMFNFSGSGGYFPVVSVRNIYGESFYRLGTIIALNIGFKDCHFAFGLTHENKLKTQDWLYEGSTTTFDNCMLLFYNSGAHATPMNFIGYRFKFNNCFLSNQIGVPFNQWTTNDPDVEYKNCRFYTRNGAINGGTVVSEFSAYNFYRSSNTNKYVDFGEDHITYTYGERYGASLTYAMQKRTVKSRMIRWIPLGSVTITVTSNDTATATIGALAGKTQFQNLLLIDLYSGSSSGKQIGRIASVDGSGNIIIDRICNRVTSGTYTLWVEDLQELRVPIMFNSNGSTMYDIYADYNGETSRTYLSPTATYYYNNNAVLISSSDTSSTTAVAGYRPDRVSRGVLTNFLYDESGYSYGNPLTNSYFNNGIMFTEGAFYTNTNQVNADSLVSGYRCVKTGVKGTPFPPEFEIVYKSKLSGSGYKLISDGSNRVKSLTAGYGLIIDSATSNNVNYKVDSSALFSAINNKYFTDGNYTPTKYNITNIDSSFFTTCHYQKIGNIVRVFGEVYVDATNSNADAQVEMSIPVSCTISFTNQLSGTGAAHLAGEAMRIYGSTLNNRAILRFKTSDNTGKTFSFSYTYTTDNTE